jgi:hypothetical protein
MIRSVQRLTAALSIVSLAACASAPTASGLKAQASAAPQARATKPARSSDSQELLHRYAERLPAGSRVTVVFTTGKRLTGTLMDVEDRSLVVKPKARMPEPAQVIALADISEIQVAGSGANILKAAGVGAGIGAATFFTFLLILIAHSE